MRPVSSMIYVSAQHIGFHNYPIAPDEVSFLRCKHRHIFKYKVAIEVFHEDREIEFFMFQKFIIDTLPSDGWDYGAMSCEMMADTVASVVGDKYPGRKVSINVSEDGENGCYKAYEAE